MWQTMKRPWGDRVSGSWWKVLLLIGGFLLTQWLATYGLFQYGVAQTGVDPLDLTVGEATALVYVHPWAFVIVEAASLAVLLLGSRLAGLRLWDWGLNKWGLLVTAFGVYGLLYGYLHLYDQLLIYVNPDFVNTQNQLALESSTQGVPVMITFLALALLGPVVEEVVFRGLMMKYLLPDAPWLGLIASATLFGLAHQPNDGWEWGLYAGMGLILGLAYLATRKLEYAILVHIINNAVAVILMSHRT